MVSSFEVLYVWRRRGFKTFTELTGLIKNGDNGMYYYIFAILEFENQKLTFAGQEEIDAPLVDFEG